MVKPTEDATNGDTNDSATTNGTAHTNGTSGKHDKKENGSATTNGLSFNAWEAASLGSDAQTEKFRRLMGIKAAPKPQVLKQINLLRFGKGIVFLEAKIGLSSTLFL